MNFRNPTQIQIGQTGTFYGDDWRVLGRVVLGVVEDGEIYYWHEFNLETATGEIATLIYERTENGPVWRWFQEFTPAYPMAAEDAARQRVGDRLNLDGTDVRVTLLESSRIYFIEGQAPAGEEVGSEANYFNAESGREMVVVSWTGDQVEYYRGHTISTREVREAFNLSGSPDLSGTPLGGLNQFGQTRNPGNSTRDFLSKAFTGILVAILIFMIVITLFRPRANRYGHNSGATVVSAPSATLNVGAAGRLAYVDYHIIGRALVEIDEVNLRFERYEYFLRDQQGGQALLVSRDSPVQGDWILYSPLNPFFHLTPGQAAQFKLGQIARVDSFVAPVDRIFSTGVKHAVFDGTPEMVDGETFYDFSGQRNSEFLLARWNATSIEFLKGRTLSNSSVLAAFGQTARAF